MLLDIDIQVGKACRKQVKLLLSCLCRCLEGKGLEELPLRDSNTQQGMDVELDHQYLLHNSDLLDK